MKKLLFLGTGFLQSFIIKRAQELGIYVIGVDGDPEAFASKQCDEFHVLDITDVQTCLEFAKRHTIDGVMTAATDYPIEAVAGIAEELGFKGISRKVAQLVKDKYRVRLALSRDEVDSINEVHLVREGEDFRDLQRVISYPSIVKPCDGSGSRGISRVDTPEQIDTAIQRAISFSRIGQCLVEPFFMGKEYGVESFVQDGTVRILGIINKRMTAPPYYAELGHVIPASLESKVEARIRESVARAIQALCIQFGPVNMDVLVSEEGQVCIADVGTRMGGNLIGSHVIPLGTGLPYPDIAILASLGEEVPVETVAEPRAVATRVLALHPGVIRSIPDIAGIESKYECKVIHQLAVGKQIRNYNNNLDGLGYVLVAGRDVSDVESRAADALKELDLSIQRI